MISSFFRLMLLCTIMGIASFGAGFVSLSVKYSRIRLLSSLGMGILVGSSLAVIIPEGIETLYSSGQMSPESQRHYNDSVSGPLNNQIYPESNLLFHKFTGISLLSGFILMFLIDKLTSLGHAQVKLGDPSELSEIQISSPFIHNTYSPVTSNDSLQSTSSTSSALILHSITDGIALGASSASREAKTSLQALVFLAIMLHKAPTAFALSTVLIRKGISSRKVTQQIAIFSLAAPFGAISTWALIILLDRSVDFSEQGIKLWTGVLLLFSGGTFLYAATHLLAEQSGQHYARSLNSKELGLAVIGMTIPWLLTTLFGHAD